MNKQKLINAIEKECQLANPELLKLEMGCRVEVTTVNGEGIYFREIQKETEGPYGKNDSLHYILIDRFKNLYCAYGHQIKTLGKEPQLNHILDVLNSKPKFGTAELHEVNMLWDMKKGLYEQDLETLQFIYSLLKS